jgi:hypothetical protein
MPAINRRHDGFHRLRLCAISSLLSLFLAALLATAAVADDAPTREDRTGYDPFETAQPAISRVAYDPFSTAGETPAILTPSSSAKNTDNVQQFAHGLTRLASDEQLPGLPQQPAPTDHASAENWSPRPLNDLTINIQLPNGMLPKNYWGEHPQPAPLCDTCGTNRGWPCDCYHWDPTCLCYQPLYFEEPNLERYGYGCGCYTCSCSTCIQSACSAAHFFGTVPALPYMMAANCPCECNYALGDYRPGSCTPWRYQCCAPCSALGAFSESSAAYGMILLLP